MNTQELVDTLKSIGDKYKVERADPKIFALYKVREKYSNLAKEVLTHNDITIESAGSSNLGRCYNATHYRITSTHHELTSALVNAIRGTGALGGGQEFREGNITKTEDGKFTVIVSDVVDSSD